MDATPFAAFAFSVAIAGACGGKSVVVEDDAQAGDSSSGKGGSSNKGGASGRGGKGGTGGDAISTGGSGGSRGGTGGSRGGTGGSRGGTGGTTGGSAGRGGFGGVGGSFAGVAGIPSGGRAGAGRGGDAGAPLGGFAGFAGFAGTVVAGFGGNPCGCYDGNPCTDDLCLELGNCVYRYNKAACDDGNACTSGDFCASGVCNPGMAISCDDGNDCTLDNCDPKGGCRYQEAGTGRDSTERKIPDSELNCGPPTRSAVSSVTLEDEGNVSNLSVAVTLEHSWGGDLTLVLAHAGVSVTLYDQFPGDRSQAANFDGTYTFAAEGDAFVKLDTAVTIPSGTYQSLQPLSAFAGIPSAGEWTLTVSDGCHGDKGTLQEFSLSVSSTCTDAASCNGTCNSGECMCLVPP